VHAIDVTAASVREQHDAVDDGGVVARARSVPLGEGVRGGDADVAGGRGDELRLAGGRQVGTGDALHVGPAAHLEVAVTLAEVPVDDGQAQGALVADHLAGLRLLAVVAKFDRAVRGAAVPVQSISVVARLVAHDEAVATAGSTALRGAARFCLAQLAAAVEGDVVAVVAGLGALDEPVPTHGAVTLAGRSGALEADLHLAGR